MARTQRHDPPDAWRPGPYETRYDVVRGYDEPPLAPRSVARPSPGMVAASRHEGDAAAPTTADPSRRGPSVAWRLPSAGWGFSRFRRAGG
jgi:hypothetical protein